MSNEPQKVFVVDDDEAVRAALRRLIRAHGLDVGTFGSAEEFLDAVSEFNRGCVVLDVELPGIDGMMLQRKLADSEIRLPIIFISAHGDIPMSVLAMKSGAEDFLTKPFREEDLLDAIHRAFERDSQSRKEHEIKQEILHRIERLTPREQEVFSFVVTGMPNREVGGILGIAEKTVKVHRARVMEKMEAGSLAELVRLSQQVSIR